MTEIPEGILAGREEVGAMVHDLSHVTPRVAKISRLGEKQHQREDNSGGYDL
jgi:hypothetical protein